MVLVVPQLRPADDALWVAVPRSALTTSGSPSSKGYTYDHDATFLVQKQGSFTILEILSIPILICRLLFSRNGPVSISPNPNSLQRSPN